MYCSGPQCKCCGHHKLYFLISLSFLSFSFPHINLFQTDCYTLPHTMIPISSLILITSYLSLSSAKTSQLQREGSLNSRSPTLCTTLGGTKCVFPFTYQGIEHYVCTYADSPTPWCATQVQYNGTTITDK